jgi:hypothetical protein
MYLSVDTWDKEDISKLQSNATLDDFQKDIERSLQIYTQSLQILSLHAYLEELGFAGEVAELDGAKRSPSPYPPELIECIEAYHQSQETAWSEIGKYWKIYDQRKREARNQRDGITNIG